MANLAEALSEALTARYMTGEIKSPASSARGLSARMNALERHFTQKGDRKGAATKRVAAALGITPRTWQRWKAGTRAPNAGVIATGHRDLVMKPRLNRRMKKLPPPQSVTVSAVINWNGYKNRQAHRSTTFGGMRNVMRNVIRAWFYRTPDDAAEVFEKGVAQANNVPLIHFEGDDVSVDFPWESP